MKVVIVISLVICVAFGCSVVGPLPTFDELFQKSEFVVTGRIIAGPAFNLFCADTGLPIYALPSKTSQVVPSPNDTQVLELQQNFDFDSNATAVVDVSCVHKGNITCASQNGYFVKGVGDVIDEECIVHIHSIDTVTSCGYFFQAGSDLKTFLMKTDGEAGSNIRNKQCYDSTYALETYVYEAISANAVESCPYAGTSYPDCPSFKCFNLVSEACCNQPFFQGEVCPVARLNLNYEYLGKCGDGKNYFERLNSILGQCYCQ